MFESGWFAGIGWGLALFFLWAQIRSLDKQQQAKAQLLATQAQLDEARQATWQLERQLSRLRFQLEDREDELKEAHDVLRGVARKLLWRGSFWKDGSRRMLDQREG